MQNFSDINKNFLTFFILIMVLYLFFSGCAPSKLKRIEKDYREGTYQKVIQSDIDCSDFSPECFKIKFIRADSYFKMVDLKQAIFYSQEAVDRISVDISMEDIYQLYILRTRILSMQFSVANDLDEKINIAEQLENDLKIALRINSRLPSTNNYMEQRDRLHILLAETLIDKMDRIYSESFEGLYQELIEVIEDFGENLSQRGQRQYYLLRAKFAYILPEIKKWMFKGSIRDEREKILNQLKNIYKEGITLRNLPIYQMGYNDRIDQFLSRVDSYMKQFIL